MMQETKALILYRLERAHEALDEADILLQRGHANTYINRLYYACFYAVSALLLTKDLSSAKHSGVRTFFHQNFVKLGIVTIELGQLYDNYSVTVRRGIMRTLCGLRLTRLDIGTMKPKNLFRHWKILLKRRSTGVKNI